MNQHRRSARAIIAILITVSPTLLACRKEQVDAPPPAASSSASAASDPLAAADAAATRLGGELKAKLQAAMKDGGPTKAIDVCAAEAPKLYAQLRKETGVTVGRASLRQRSEADAPPPWVAEWLKAQGERKAEGVSGVRAVVDGASGGRVARVLRPVAIEAPCLACHGDPTTLAPEVKTLLAAKYPKDAATGYALGDLRGALWAERPSP